MKKIFTHLFALFLLSLVSSGAWAQFQNGKVYRIVCSGTTTVSLGASALTDVAAVSTSETEKAQQWYVTVSGSNYTFRNLANGRYLQGNNDTSGGWALTEDSNEDSNKFTVTLVNGNYAIRGASHSNGYGYMHKDNGNNIVSWESGAANSQWTPIEVSYTIEELQAVWDEVEALVVPSSTVTGYQEKLDAMFTDQSCTKLNDTYAAKSLSTIQSDANYTGLPAVLRAMVVKVYNEQVSGSTTAWAESTVAPADRPNGNNNTNHNLWTVADTWDNDYAKKFRVQMYEPYSVEGEITSYLRINAHCNMDNPTGIYANAGEPMYIMVEGTIAEGAELWVAHQVGHGATNYYNNAAYTQLHEGLNVVPYFANGSQLWINYLVHTYNSSGTTIAEKFPEDRQLSKYKPLKIHIEGGKINGFFNAMGDYRSTEVSGDANGGENLWGEVDNDADWNYYKARAALSGDFALLGHRQTLLFDFGTYNSTNGYFGVANADGGIEKALAWHLENIEVPTTPNCYAGSGKDFGDYSDTYYPGMQLSATTGKINIMLEAWDRIQYSEHASLGLLSVANINKMNALYPRWTTAGEAAEIYNYGEATINNVTQTYQQFCQGIDYSEYFNHHGAAVGAGSGYMSGGWRVCNYHYNTMGSIIGKIAVEPGPTWGPAHEIGHQHQTIFNLNGQTEVTNNFHSNVAVWYMGMGTSRYNGSEGSLSSVLGAFNTDGNDLYTNNIWAITHLYYRLWLYYHLAGNNTQFWPRLFELLRQVPIVNGGQISGETSLLRFYQHACDAAGEDLTEFFRAHGFFELMTDRLVGDYSNGTYNVTEEQIETAISAVKAKNYPVNYAVLLINDGTSETTLKHDGESKRALWDNNPSAEYGSVTDFIEGNTDVTAYEATVSADGTVTMSGGTGGVGFLILNEKGEIVSFSNKASFEISDEAAYLLATGKASVVAVDAESTKMPAEVDLSAIQREMLLALINKVEAMPIDDGSYTHVGFYTKASATELLAALGSAKTAYESGSGYGAAYEMLYAEKEKFVNSQNLSFVPFDPSLTYVITNCAYSGKTMHLNSGLKSATGVDQTANTARWQFKTTDTEGVYKLYNTAGYYLTAPAKSATVGSTATVDDAATFTLLQESPVGAWSISLTPAGEYTTLHDNSYGNVVGWSAGVDPSKWYLTAVENPNRASLVSTDELQALIAKTETLVDLVGEISYTFSETPVALQTTNETGDYYVRTNATNTGGNNEGPIANLVDNNLGNYFHTQYANSAKSDDNLDHYIEVNMGSGALSAFRFSYTTRSGVYNDYPQIIKVYGSNTENKTGDESEYVLLATVSSGLPASNTQTTYTYPTAIDAGIAYKYLRFMVPTTNNNRVSGGSEHNYWHMAEFDIAEATATATARGEYSTIDAAKILAAYNALNAAKSWVNYEKLTEQQLENAKSNLQTAYNALKGAYDAVIKAKQEELEALADATDEVIKSVGTVELVVETPITLSASNLYCNQVNTTESGSGDSYIERLTDGDTGTYLHTTNTEGYLRIDLGENSTATAFKFSYTTRSNGNNRPTNIVVEGCNEQDGTYTTITELSEGLPSGNAAVYNSDIINMSQAYRYVRLRVTNAITNSANSKIFVMSEFSITTVKERNITIELAYEGIVSEDLLYSTYNTSEDSHLMAAETSHPTLAQLEAQITKLTEAKATLEAAMAQVNKDELVALVGNATTLYNKMSDGNGNMNADYATSSLTAEQLTAVKDALDAAQSVVDYAGSTQLQVNEAKDALYEKYQVLVSVEDTNEKNSLATDGLTTLIGNVKTLLGTIADATASKTEIALQVSDADSEFYLWSNNPAGDSDGIGALLDNNTGTFFGTQWGSVVDAYTHYIEIDMGDAIAVDKLLFGYTTRNSTHANQRPTAIKVLGSNNKVDYTEIETISDGLATEAAERWSMDTPLSLAARYRYIRFAVATQPTTGFFNMSEFDLYANIDYSLKDYYTTATGLGFVELCLALQSAEDLLTRDYITTAQYDAVYNKLSGCYTTADAVVDNDYTERGALENLIDDAATLISEVATVTEVETPVLSTANVYCNADNSTNTGASADDKLGVAALLDGKVSTHLHTTYGGNAQDDDLDHYIRVDLGDASVVTAFKFNYKGRQANSNNAPTNMTVEAGNSIEAGAEWVTLATLSELPTGTAPVSYESELIEMSEAYRYVRFMVTGTQNNSKTTYNNIAHPFFVMSEFSFTAHSTIEVKEGYTNVTKELVRAAYNEKNTATGKNACYMSESEYNEALDALQAAYDALVAASQVDKTELEELIAATTILKNRMYEIESYTANEITLQNDTEGAAGYLYCNAAGSTNNYSGDNLGVDALLDNDTNTSNFLHTTYYGNDNKDGLDHYLRVDLGESKEYIRFRYKGRSGYAALTPKNAVVQATNDLSGEWTNIATLYGLTQTTDEVSTACLGNGVAYRYWRFMVTATYDGRKHDGHPYYALSAFNVDVCTDVVISSQLKSEYNPEIYIYTTSTLVTEVENAITAANSVVDNEEVSQTDVNSEVDALQAVYDKLEEALKYAGIPVVITTDEENPVLYRIISKRADDDSKVLQFDEPATNKVAIVATANNASYQAWYFMQGEYGYLIKPFNGCGKVLSVESTGNGSAKANIAEESENIYSEWNFSRSAVAGCTDYFYIYVNGTSHACLSHNGGFNETDKLGIWSNGWNTDDGGSLFKFVEAEFDNDNARYYQLSDFENTLEYQTANTPEGTTVGAFVNGTAYGTAYSTASTLIEAGNTSATADCYAAYTALREESKTVKMIIPEAGKYYRIDITPGLTDSRAGASMRVDENGKLAWGEYAAANASYIFTFEYDADDNLYMKNLHTATYLDEAPANNTNKQVGADAETITDAESNAVVAKSISINTLGKSGEAVVVGITPNGGAMLNCKAEDSYIVAFDNTAVDKASAWVITEVALEDVVENIEYSATLGADQTATEPVAYSTLYLSYNATIPGGVTASIVEEIDGDGQLVLVPVTGGILPANTAVVLSQEKEGNVVFEYTDEESTFDTEGNILKGTSFTRYVECGDEYNIYVLSRKNGHMAFYWAYENRDANGDYVYINANEEIVEKTAEGAHKNHNKGGWVKCNANKSYLQVDEANGVAAAAMFSFLVGGNTTDIESINAVADEYGNVYDLQGRKLTEITSPGLYIVNGKKVYVK